jgi:hypothetical protein
MQYPTIDQPLSVDTPDGSQVDLSGQVPLDPAEPSPAGRNHEDWAEDGAGPTAD